MDRRTLITAGLAAASLAGPAAAQVRFTSPSASILPAAGLDIVDAQAHLDLTNVEGCVAAMDALGIRGVVIDELTGLDAQGRPRPFYELPGGGFRPITPGAEAAAYRFPDRFSYLLRIERRDPDPEFQVKLLKRSPAGRAARVAIGSPDDRRALEEGGYDPLFRLLQDHRVPVFVFIPGAAARLASTVRRFPDLTFIIDHCGVPMRRGPDTLAALDQAIGLARFPNTALKWSHATSRISAQAYPFADLRPLLGKALDGFGRERVMWGSDYTQEREHNSWAEALFCLRDSPALSEDDKAWLLGGTLRKLLDWPKA